MFGCAIAWDHPPGAAGNSCTGTVRYCRPALGLVFGADMLANLRAILHRLETDRSLSLAAVRLNLFPGCGPEETLRLRWRGLKPVRLALIAATTGRRQFLFGEAGPQFLGNVADTTTVKRALLDGKKNNPLTHNDLVSSWRKTRDVVGIMVDARLHDLRYVHASRAAMSGALLLGEWQFLSGPRYRPSSK